MNCAKCGEDTRSALISSTHDGQVTAMCSKCHVVFSKHVGKMIRDDNYARGVVEAGGSAGSGAEVFQSYANPSAPRFDGTLHTLAAPFDPVAHTGLVTISAGEYERMRKTVRDLYLAGRWTCDALAKDEQVHLWESLRDAFDIPPRDGNRGC